jgi:hypothetical protein
VAPSVETIATFHHIHPLVEVDLPPFVNNFHPKMDLVLDKEAFIFALTHFPCLSSKSFSSMVYELLHDCFDPNGSISGF